MKLTIDVARKRLIQVAERVVPPDEAAYFADAMITAHARKAPRMNPLQEAVDDLKVWLGAETRDLTLEVDNPGVLLIDFGGLAPSLKLKYVHDELEARARACGLAAVGFRNSSGVITLDPWSEGLAGRDLIGIAMFDGGTGCTVPFGGTKGVFGTLPVAYAVPTVGEPIILDMAMTEIPYFAVASAKEERTPLPPGAAVDQHGRPTTDAAAALDDAGVANLLPIGGGFKGYGLAMLAEILTGPLVRGLASTAQTPGWHPPEYGGLICAFDIAGFTDPARFKREVGEMCEAIRRQPPAEGVTAVAIPGDRGHEKVAAARGAGTLEVGEQTAAELEELAART